MRQSSSNDRFWEASPGKINCSGQENGEEVQIIEPVDDLLHSRSQDNDRVGMDGDRRGILKKNKNHKYLASYCHQIAKARNGKFISSLNLEDRVRISDLTEWECEQGHIWKTRFHNIIYDKCWCPICKGLEAGNRKRLTKQQIYQRLNHLEYRLADNIENYDNANEKVVFKHVVCGNLFESSLHTIFSAKNSIHCPACSKHKVGSQDEAVSYAKTNGGKLVEWVEWNSAKSKWMCNKGHVWRASWSRIRRDKSWCGKCVQKFYKKEWTPVLMKKALNQYRKYDENKGFEFNLDLDFMIALSKSKCHYCDRPATGADRKSNFKGHTKENCVASCLRCNWVRGDWLSYETMIQVGELLKKIDP